MAGLLEYKDFELSDNETDMLAEQGDDVLVEFCPQVQNRYGKLIIFAVSLLTVFGNKYLGYLAMEAKKPKDKKPDDKENPEKPIQAIGQMPGTSQKVVV